MELTSGLITACEAYLAEHAEIARNLYNAVMESRDSVEDKVYTLDEFIYALDNYDYLRILQMGQNSDEYCSADKYFRIEDDHIISSDDFKKIMVGDYRSLLEHTLEDELPEGLAKIIKIWSES